MAKPPLDSKAGHHWFAVECNNEAWAIAEAKSRTAGDIERMIHAAHAACYHWQHAGKLLNHLRAEQLLTVAYLVAARPESAMRHAKRMLELDEQAGNDRSPFDIACTLAWSALAHRLNGSEDDAATLAERFGSACEDLASEPDRKFLREFYDRLSMAMP